MLQTRAEGIQDYTGICGKDVPMRTVQKIWLYDQMVWHKPESIPENETDKILWDFEIQRDHLIPVRWPDLKKKKKKKRKKKRKKKENLFFSGFCLSSEPLSKKQRKERERQEVRPC